MNLLMMQRVGRVKVKTSLLWSTDLFCFEQIYQNQDYDYLAFLGLCPQAVFCWFVPVEEAFRNGVTQHGKETRWIRFDPSDTPEWIEYFGGDVADQATQMVLCEVWEDAQNGKS